MRTFFVCLLYKHVPQPVGNQLSVQAEAAEVKSWLSMRFTFKVGQPRSRWWALGWQHTQSQSGTAKTAKHTAPSAPVPLTAAVLRHQSWPAYLLGKNLHQSRLSCSQAMVDKRENKSQQHQKRLCKYKGKLFAIEAPASETQVRLSCVYAGVCAWAYRNHQSRKRTCAVSGDHL